MTIANSFAAKLGVAFVAIAMALMMFAPAKAQTAEELQAQIDSLMATINALQAQLGVTTTTPAGSASAYMFTRSLTVGAQGADVTALQTYLIAGGYSIPAGATGYFGSQTQAAVAAWQAANGVTPAAGYFGPVSQAKYSALMAAVVVPPTTGTGTGTGTGSTVTLSGEASLDDTDLKDGDDTDIEEGQEAAPVAEYTVKYTDGDALITRLDVALTANGSEEDPWKTFSSVSLWVDGDQVAEKDADSKDDYVGDEDDGILRFSDLDIVAKEGEDLDITIGVTAQDGVDSLPATWNIDVTGMRWEDADGVNTTETDDSINVDSTNFDLDEAGTDDELAVKTSSETPDATTLQLDDTDKSDWLNVFSFDLDTEDSVNDIALNHIPVTITTVGDDFGSIVNDLQLVIDGETYDDWSLVSGGTGSTTVVVDFDIDGDHTIDAGDRETAELQVEFKALATEGATIQGKVTTANADDINAEGSDDLDASQLKGSANGEIQTLRTSGATLDLTSTTETLKTNSDATTTDDSGTFVLKFDVTAFESDMYINKSAASSTASAGNQGVHYIITNGSGNQVTSGTPTASLSSTADTDGTQYVVHEGETETFTLTVSLDPTVSGFYGVQLYSLNFNPNQGDNPSDTDGTYQKVTNGSDFETDALEI